MDLLLQAQSGYCNARAVDFHIELIQSRRESLDFVRPKKEDTGLNCSVVQTNRSEAVRTRWHSVVDIGPVADRLAVYIVAVGGIHHMRSAFAYMAVGLDRVLADLKCYQDRMETLHHSLVPARKIGSLHSYMDDRKHEVEGDQVRSCHHGVSSPKRREAFLYRDRYWLS